MDISAFDLSVIACKSAVVLVFLLLLYRFLGKRDIAQYNVYDLVTVMAVANAIQNAITTGSGKLLAGIVSSGTLILLGYFLSKLFVHSEGSRRLLLGVPVLLVNDGIVMDLRMRREHVSRTELDEVIRIHGLRGPRDVALAVLEIDGSISIIPKGRKCETVGIDV